MSVAMVETMLQAADTLVERLPASSAFRRRAVSTAYYAVFHTLAKLIAGSLLPDASQDSEEYLRVYRALDHGPLKNAFNQSPLRDEPRLRTIGHVVTRLQSERIKADYLPPNPAPFSKSEAMDLIAQAQQVVADLANLSEADRRTLAVCLVFRNRKDSPQS